MTNPLNSEAVFDALREQGQRDPESLDRKQTKVGPKKSSLNENEKPSGKAMGKRPTRSLNEYNNPESSSDPSEQLQMIAENLGNKIANGNSLSATMFAHEWLDGIVDGNGNLYEPVKEELSSLDKGDLIKFIGGILGSLK